MDIFENQEQRRKRSWQLIAVFIAAGMIAVFLIYYISAFFLMFTSFYFSIIYIFLPLADLIKYIAFANKPEVFALRPMLVIGLPIACVITTVTYKQVKSIQEGGGAYIAQCLGAQLLDIRPKNPKEMLLVNIVEEIAVAASLPTPLIYILGKDNGINAMTAGITPHDAVIVLTQGSLDLLSRDEMQGVVAHEFGHIINGDCSINCLMAGYLAGLMYFCVIGRGLINETDLIFDIEENYVLLPLLMVIIGAVIYTAGLLGKWCAEIIQAAFSRQREYLADALAVQFTRNPRGLAGALKKIGGLRQGGFVHSGKAILFSPFFITSPNKSWNLLRTHPSLSSRIELLEPDWDGHFETIEYLPKLNRKREETRDFSAIVKNPLLNPIANSSADLTGLEAWRSVLPESMLIAMSSKIPSLPNFSAMLPPEIMQSRDYQAVAAAAILHGRPDEQYPQQCTLSIQAQKFQPYITGENRLTVLSFAVEHLKNDADYRLELKNIAVRSLLPINEDSSFSDVAVYWLVMRVAKAIKIPLEIEQGISSYIANIRYSTGELLSVLAWQSAASEQEAMEHYQRSFRKFLHWSAPELIPSQNATAMCLHKSLQVLSLASKAIKHGTLTAAIEIAIEDGHINQAESEYLWAIYSALN